MVDHTFQLGKPVNYVCNFFAKDGLYIFQAYICVLNNVMKQSCYNTLGSKSDLFGNDTRYCKGVHNIKLSGAAANTLVCLRCQSKSLSNQTLILWCLAPWTVFDYILKLAFGFKLLLIKRLLCH